MSKIDELIQDLCPNGINFENLGDVTVSIKTGLNPRQNFKLNTTDAQNYYVTVKEITTGKVRFSDKTDKINDKALSIIQGRSKLDVGDVLFSGIGTIGKVAIVDFPTNNWNCSESVFLIKPNKSFVEPKFLMYILGSDIAKKQYASQSVGSTLKGVRMATLSLLRIPVPPLLVQKEIVDILDKFTQLEAELSAELSARRRQHAYYWNHLLAPRETWKTTTLGEIASVFDGPHATPKKTVTGPWYLSISSLKNGQVDLTESAHLSEGEYPTWTRRVEPRVGDTLFSYETRIGQAGYWDTDEPAALGRRMGLLRPRIDLVHPRFLTLLYLGPQLQKLIQIKTVKGSTVDRIPIANMASWKVSIPSLDEQVKIIQQVNAFDALVNDLNVGLPAELAARRKQYEYYRTKLLTFQELSA